MKNYRLLVALAHRAQAIGPHAESKAIPFPILRDSHRDQECAIHTQKALIRIRSIARSDTQKRDRLGTTRRLPVPGTPPSPARSEASMSGNYSHLHTTLNKSRDEKLSIASTTLVSHSTNRPVPNQSKNDKRLHLGSNQGPIG